jgi:hypothetical protein
MDFDFHLFSYLLTDRFTDRRNVKVSDSCSFYFSNYNKLFLISCVDREGSACIGA